MIGLNRIITLSFTWFNINAGYNNQLIGYSKDTGSNIHQYCISAGVWNYTDIKSTHQEAQ